MTDRLLAKKDLAAFLDKIRAEHSIFAPAQDGSKLVWKELDKAEDMLFDYSNTHMSPKDYFFPQSETLMRFKNTDEEGGMVLEPVEPMQGKNALVGIRPCDAKAFQVLDMIFVQDELTDDVYWKDKREKTLLVGMACSDPCPTCFCTSVNCGPHHTEGLDLLMVDLGDDLLIKVISDKGEAVAADLAEADEMAAKNAEVQKAKAEESITSSVATDKIQERTVLELFGQPLWEKICEGCLNCGTCTFTCPTCHCFDIQDEVQGDEGRRVRNWDYCMSWLFTVHATGHNPRGAKKERVRQRFMHKFKYIPMKRDGEIGCVGCGRCVTLCPVNIDVRKVVNEMNS